MSIYTPNGYWGDRGVMPARLSWKRETPCDFHSPDIGTHADLCGRCGWRREEHIVALVTFGDPRPAEEG